MAFEITPRESVFRMVVRSQIVVPPTISPSQWHSRDLNSWPWLWYHLSDREMYHSTSKPIGDKKDTFKSLMTFDITSRGHIFRMAIGSQIVVSNRNSTKYAYFLREKVQNTVNPLLVFIYIWCFSLFGSVTYTLEGNMKFSRVFTNSNITSLWILASQYDQ